MKASPQTSSLRATTALTLIELLVLIAIIAVLAAMIPCAPAGAKAKAQRINCANNLKSLGLSFRLWAGDNGERFPVAVSVTNGGTMELVADGKVYPHFAVMSNELGTPKILSCPSDRAHAHATNLSSMRDTNISYFLGLNATGISSQTWLAGDRNITNLFAPSHGVLTISTNAPVGWTEQLHRRAGNLGLADGSVQQCSNSKLTESLRSQTNAPLRLAMPE